MVNFRVDGNGGDFMADRVILVRDGAVVRVVAEDVERFKALGYAEKRKPAPRKPRTEDKGGE